MFILIEIKQNEENKLTLQLLDSLISSFIFCTTYLKNHKVYSNFFFSELDNKFVIFYCRSSFIKKMSRSHPGKGDERTLAVSFYFVYSFLSYSINVI